MRSMRWLAAAMVLAAALRPGAAAAPPAGKAQAGIHITGRLIDVNGQTVVPRGLLGLHADARLTVERARDWGVDGFRQIHFVPGSGSIAMGKDGTLQEPFRDMAVVIDCQGDRFYPAVCLTNPNYRELFDKIGRQYAQRCRDANWHGYAEFWNEPYLNWAERSRKNYDPKFYDVTKAAEDAPVTIKGWDQPLKYLKWRRFWAADEAGKINYLVPVPKGAKAGDKFDHELNLYFTEKGRKTYTVVEKWDVYDPTAVSYWSGKQNYDFYMWMLLPWAKAIKETNPKVTVIAGWDFHISSDGWKAWEILYKPMIDEAIQWLDGVTEHHYGSDTRMTAATYEVVVGYGVSEHGKWLKCYNTETAGCVDPAVPGNRHGNATPYGAYNYGLRDIVELVYRSPCKAVSRTAHGSLAPGWGGGGDEFLFKLLKDFRGRLIHATTGDLSIWPAVALSGDQLVAVIFNDHNQDRQVPVRVDAPAGTTFADGQRVWVVPKEEKGPLEFRDEKLPAGGSRLDIVLTIPQKTGMKLVLPLKGSPPAKTELLRRQFFAKGILNKVQGGKGLTLSVKVDEAQLARAEAAAVRIVLEGVKGGEASIRVNGTTFAIPDHDWITEVPIPPAILKAENTLVFQTSGDGYQVDVASVVVDAPPR